MAETKPEDTFDFPAVPTRADLTLNALPQANLPKELGEWADVWKKLPRDGNAIPLKAKLSIPQLGRLAASVVIFEKHASGQYTLRLAGTEVEAWIGQSLTGLDPLMLVPERQRQRVAAVYDHVTEQPCGFYIVEALMLRQGKQVDISTLKLPLLDNEGNIRFFLSSYHFAEVEFVPSFKEEAPAEHRKIDRLGYIDIGFGLPK